jgi:hypothetical protein
MIGHLVIVTDAWHPQVNGVVRTLTHLREGLWQRGHRVTMITPQDYRTLPCPTYPEIRLALTTRRRLARRLGELQPAYVHIATEGPLGILARSVCLRNNWPFTTSFHTGICPRKGAHSTVVNLSLPAALSRECADMPRSNTVNQGRTCRARNN